MPYIWLDGNEVRYFCPTEDCKQLLNSKNVNQKKLHKHVNQLETNQVFYPIIVFSEENNFL